MRTMRAAAVLAAMMAASCGGDAPPRDQLRAASDACQKIDRRPESECHCRAGVLAAQLTPGEFEIYAWYRAHWARDVLYPEAAGQAARAAAERFSRSPADLAAILAAETAHAEALKACDGK